MEEQNPRLTTGSSPVYHRFIKGTRSALSSWLLTSGPTPFCLCKPFSCKACLGKMDLPKKNLLSPKPGHTTGVSRRGARRGGGAGSGRTVCQQNCSPRGQYFFVPSKASKTRRLNVSPEARTSEILCKPMEEQNPRLTTGSSPVYQRFITGTRSALFSWLLTSGPTPFCLCKPFSFPDMPCMKRVTKTNRRRYTGQQPGMKSARGPGDKPRMNRGSTAGFVPPSV